MLEFERDGAELSASVVDSDVLVKLRDEFTRLNLKAGGRSFDLSPLVLALLSPSGGTGRVAAGRLTSTQVRDIARTRSVATCDADAGDLVVMKAMTVHGSDAAKRPTRRRVLHVDYCCCSLPDGLDWALNINP